MSKRAWRFRISVTALMFIVAVAALICYGAMLRRRMTDYRRATKSNGDFERWYRGQAGSLVSRDEIDNDYVDRVIQKEKLYCATDGRPYPPSKEFEKWVTEAKERSSRVKSETYRLTSWAHHYALLRRKYEYAAVHPWFGVAA